MKLNRKCMHINFVVNDRLLLKLLYFIIFLDLICFNCHIVVLNIFRIIYYRTLQLAMRMALNATHVLGNIEAFAPERWSLAYVHAQNEWNNTSQLMVLRVQERKELYSYQAVGGCSMPSCQVGLRQPFEYNSEALVKAIRFLPRPAQLAFITWQTEIFHYLPTAQYF